MAFNLENENHKAPLEVTNGLSLTKDLAQIFGLTEKEFNTLLPVLQDYSFAYIQCEERIKRIEKLDTSEEGIIIRDFYNASKIPLNCVDISLSCYRAIDELGLPEKLSERGFILTGV